VEPELFEREPVENPFIIIKHMMKNDKYILHEYVDNIILDPFRFIDNDAGWNVAIELLFSMNSDGFRLLDHMAKWAIICNTEIKHVIKDNIMMSRPEFDRDRGYYATYHKRHHIGPNIVCIIYVLDKLNLSDKYSIFGEMITLLQNSLYKNELRYEK
jgi:hypothetical protein